jgi:hypothetical protein
MILYCYLLFCVGVTLGLSPTQVKKKLEVFENTEPR